MKDTINMNEVIITELGFPDNIRQNIGMYLGSTKEFSTPVREIINNSTDELLNNYGDKLYIYADKPEKLVIDNGRGLPYYEDPNNPGKTITQSILTKTHTGSKFSNKNEKTGGLHGVGSTATNAASAFYQVFVNCSKKDNSTTLKSLQDKINSIDNPVFTIRYEKGILVKEDIISYDEMMNIIKSIYPSVNFTDWSTVVLFKPDSEIYESSKSHVAQLPLKLVRLEAPKSKIYVSDNEVTEFDFDKDVYSLEHSFLGKVFDLKVDLPELDSSFSIFFTYDKDARFDYQQTSLINLVNTPQGGYIEDVAWRSLGNALKSINPMLKQSDAKLGLRLFVSSFTGLKMFFNSQTKDKLAKLSLKDDYKQRPIDKELFTKGLTPYFLEIVNNPENSDFFKSVVNRIIEYKRSLDRLSKKDFVLSHIEYSGKDSTASLGLGSKGNTLRHRPGPGGTGFQQGLLGFGRTLCYV